MKSLKTAEEQQLLTFVNKVLPNQQEYLCDNPWDEISTYFQTLRCKKNTPMFKILNVMIGTDLFAEI